MSCNTIFNSFPARFFCYESEELRLIKSVFMGARERERCLGEGLNNDDVHENSNAISIEI
jgi:hypothetical protein